MKFTRSPRLALAAILLFALCLRAYFYIGEGFTDDDEYVMIAHRASLGHPFAMDFLQSTSNGQIRSMSVLPVALCFKLFGFRVKSASVYFFFCSLGSILLTYLIAARFFGIEVGLLAALLYSVFPLDLFYSTQISGDVAVPFYILLGLFLLIKNRPFWAGVIWGIGVAAKENGILFLPVFAIYALTRPSWQAYLRTTPKHVLAGFLLVFSLELLLFAWITRDPFHRIRIDYWTAMNVPTQTDLGYYPRILLSLFPPREGLMGLFPIVVLLLFRLGYKSGIRSEKKNALFLLLWLLLVGCTLQFGVMSLHFRPIAKWIRYLTVLIPPLVILSAYGLAKIPKIPRAGILFILFAHSLWAIHISAFNTKAGVEEISGIAEALRPLPPKATYIHSFLQGRVYAQLGGTWEFRDYCECKRIEDISDSYVVVAANFLDDPKAKDVCRSRVSDIPKNWRIIARTGSREGTPIVYYAPRKKPALSEYVTK